MTLQVLPPEMLEGPKDKIETKEPQLIGNQAASKMENQKSSAYSVVMKRVTQSLVGNMPQKNAAITVNLVLLVTSLAALTLGSLMTSHVKPTGPNPTVPRLTEPSSNQGGSLLG